MDNILYLRKIRDFGEKLSDSINFIKYNWKNLVVLYLVYVVPFLLVATLLGASSFSNFFARFRGFTGSNGSGTFPTDVFNASFFLAILLYVLSIASYATSVYLYIRLYEQHDGRKPTISAIGRLFFPKLLSNLLYAVMVFLMFFVLVFFAIIPFIGWLIAFIGIIYMMVNFSILFCVNTVEDNSFPTSIYRCFSLLKENWWATFGYWIILGMIYYFISSVLSLIINLIFGFSAINFLTPTDESLFSEKYFLVTGLSVVVTQIFYLIVYVGMAVLFYSIKEEKEGSGLEDRLDQLGTQGGLHGEMEEQY